MLTIAARVNKLFGIDGGLMLTLYTVFPRKFTIDTPLFVRIDGLDVPLWCKSFERRGTAGSVVHFADIDTERRARELISKELYIDLPDQEEEADDTFYMEDLIGFKAESDGLTGEVTDYYDNEANPLFEITSNAGDAILIPAAEEFIIRIDFKRRKIHFTLPEGLIGLNDKREER